MRSYHAPAKLNLALHVTGKRADGYHLLESLVAFTAWGDRLDILPTQDGRLTLDVTGPFAEDAGMGEGNLVLRAARGLQRHAPAQQGAMLRLVKNIPVGAGLGGGSADAAALLKGLRDAWGLTCSDTDLQEMGAALGADIPMCIGGEPAMVQGIGERLTALPAPFPSGIHAVLAHPRVPLLTRDVYQAWSVHPQTRGGLPPITPDNLADLSALCRWLGETRNDLQAPASTCCSRVAELLGVMQALLPRPDFVRMTGSGACCFALFEEEAKAKDYAKKLGEAFPNGWVCATQILPPKLG